MSKFTLSWREDGRVHVQATDPDDFSNKKYGVVRIGRDPRLCDVVLSSPRVSRLHAEISFDPHKDKFYIHNLRESNPILVDGQQLTRGSLALRERASIRLGKVAVQVSYLSSPSPKREDLHFQRDATPDSSLTLSHYIPLASRGREFAQKALLLPGVLTVICVVLLFTSAGNTVFFNLLLATYLGIAGFYFIYQLCGKQKHWWALIIPFISTPILLLTPVWWAIALIFRGILPGQLPAQSANFLSIFIAFFFGAGLAEELLKALPVFGLEWLGRMQPSPRRERVGVTEPLDGILLGAASGLGFTLLETLGQYVPNLINEVSMQAGEGAGELLGLQLLIPRIVGSVFGHMAYRGKTSEAVTRGNLA